MKKITHKKCTHKSVQLCNEGLAFQYTNYRKRKVQSILMLKSDCQMYGK